MPRTRGWRREGSRGRFRYLDARGRRISDEDQLERIRSLVIPPAWKDVWISPKPAAKLQATGVDAAGRRQYLYHSDFRAQQDQAKFDRLIRFAEKLPELRAAMSRHMDNDSLDRERVAAIATRLINRGWFRVGTERYAKESRTFGITTLRKSHVRVRGTRIMFDFRGKHRAVVRTTLVDDELAAAISGIARASRRSQALPLRVGGRPLQPHGRPAERLRSEVSRRRVHGQGFPHLGRDVDRSDRLRRARRRPRRRQRRNASSPP